MAKTWRLARVKQCAKCPWKKSTDPRSIPNGYTEDLHRALAGTIAEPGDLTLALNGGAMKVFGCHEHTEDKPAHCVGWIAQQAGVGNNIALRIMLMTCENADRIETFGEQHETFEDTLP